MASATTHSKFSIKWSPTSSLSSFQRKPTLKYQISHLKMGGNFSNFDYADASSKSSRILSFHSTAKWKAHFDASKETDKLMVIDFTATWCGPCKCMDPSIKEFSAKYTDIEFIKIDVDELMDVAQEYKVQAMPTFILIKKGKVVDKLVGAKKDELQKLIEKHRK